MHGVLPYKKVFGHVLWSMTRIHYCCGSMKCVFKCVFSRNCDTAILVNHAGNFFQGSQNRRVSAEAVLAEELDRAWQDLEAKETLIRHLGSIAAPEERRFSGRGV